MPRDPNTQPPTDATLPVGIEEKAPRRSYAAPRLKRLGSVRDLTLGSPLLPSNDFMGGRMP